MIETGVDRLIKLVEEKQRISFKDAAKELNVGLSTIKEWSTSLGNEENIVVEFKFTTPFFVVKSSMASPDESRIKKMHKEKEEHLKKIESSINTLNEHRTGLEQAKERISGIKDELAEHASVLQDEVKNLSPEEQSSKEAELKKYIMQRINAINKKLMEEEQKYEEFSEKIRKETENLNESFRNIADHMKQAADWINYLKGQEELQEKKIKELEKSIKAKK